MPYEDQEDHHERMMLVRVEAEAANQAARTSTTLSTPIEEYGLMPVPLREGTKAATGWCLNTRVPNSSSSDDAWAAIGQRRQRPCSGHRPIPLFHVTFGELGKSKGLGKWKSRALAVHVPSEAVLPCRSINDIDRLMTLMLLASAPRGLEITADMKTREEHVSQDLPRIWQLQKPELCKRSLRMTHARLPIFSCPHPHWKRSRIGSQAFMLSMRRKTCLHGMRSHCTVPYASHPAVGRSSWPH